MHSDLHDREVERQRMRGVLAVPDNSESVIEQFGEDASLSQAAVADPHSIHDEQLLHDVDASSVYPCTEYEDVFSYSGDFDNP